MSEQPDVWFPRDYQESRGQFLAVAEQLGGEQESHAIDSLGPTGESLSIDLTMLGDRNAESCLVLSSSLHGLEGPLGAAIQMRQMRRFLQQGVPAGVRIVLIHALNPYGFSFQRRCEAENIDLNRSFMRRGEERRGAPPLYETLDPFLNPESPPGGFDLFYLRAAGYLARYGMPSVKQAIAGGQYEFPRGLFYGGKGESETQRLLTPHWKSWLGESRRVIHLDVHTGLGRWGELTLLSAADLETPWQQQANQALGGTGFEQEREKAGAFSARGDFGLWCAQQAGEIDFAYFCAEFGTYPAIRVLKALRAENQAHHWGEPGASGYQKAKQAAAEAFCPASLAWRKLTVERGDVLCDAAISQLKQ